MKEEMKKYPRYFVHTDGLTDPKVWMSYCYVKRKNGKIHYERKDGKRNKGGISAFVFVKI